MGRSKTNLSKWGYADIADTACECGTSEQTMQHLLRCPLLENECSLEDLATANEKALHKSLAKHMTKFGDDGHERRISFCVRTCKYNAFTTVFDEAAILDKHRWRLWSPVFACFFVYIHWASKEHHFLQSNTH